MFMEELFWGCAGIGLAIAMPALAFDRGAPLRTRAANAVLSMQNRIPEPVLQIAMKMLRPLRK